MANGILVKLKIIQECDVKASMKKGRNLLILNFCFKRQISANSLNTYICLKEEFYMRIMQKKNVQMSTKSFPWCPQAKVNCQSPTCHSWSKLALHYYIKNYIQCSSTGVYKRGSLRLLTASGSDQISSKLITLSLTFFQ